MPTRARLALSLALSLALAGCDETPGAPPPGTAEAEAWRASLSSVVADDPDAEAAIPRPALLPRLSVGRAAELFPLQNGFRYDPFAYFRHPPHKQYSMDWEEHPDGRWTFRTNSLGLREDEEPGERRPDLLVLATGDSHTDGVGNNAESWANRLESILAGELPERRVEVWNAGVGYYTFTNYLGTLVRFLPVEPDVFVVGVFGGNDLAEQLVPLHGFAGGSRPKLGGEYMERLLAAREVEDGAGAQALGQGLNQLAYFRTLPEQAELALASAQENLAEMQRICAERGIGFVVLYVPPPLDAAGPELAPTFAAVSAALGLEPDDLGLLDRLAERMLAAAREAGIRVVDGRAALAGADEPLYWRRDHHVSVAAQRRLASALAPVVAELLRQRAGPEGPSAPRPPAPPTGPPPPKGTTPLPRR